LPHVIFITNGGPSELAFGVKTVSEIEDRIARAIAEKTANPDGDPSPDVVLRRIVHCAAAGK